MSAAASVSPNLGISAKSSNATGKKPNSETQPFDGKKLKYALQRTAQGLLYDATANKQHRVCSCHRNVASDGVAVYRNADASGARFGNLISCGSVWSCPICSAKITEARRADMQKAQSGWLLEGGSCLLNTLTFPHEHDMPLAELLEKFGKALDLYKNSRTYKRIFGTAVALIQQKISKGKPLKSIKEGQFPRLGTVRSLEVTHGVNGWHPHVHEVLFMQDDALLEAQRAKDELTAEWVRCLLAVGLGSNDKLEHMLERAWDIRGGDYVSDYINKFGREPMPSEKFKELFGDKARQGWSIAHEVTKGISKIGREGRQIGEEWHFTPFQLLDWAMNGDEGAGQLFREFSRCFEGKRMNYWTNGLKDWFGINEIDDEALAEEGEPQPEEELVHRISSDDWKTVLETNARSEVLAVAAADGKEGLLKLLEEIKGRPRVYRGWFQDHARPDISRFYR